MSIDAWKNSPTRRRMEAERKREVACIQALRGLNPAALAEVLAAADAAPVPHDPNATWYIRLKAALSALRAGEEKKG